MGGMKGLYVGLGVLVVVGGGAFYWVNGGGGGSIPMGPVPLSAVEAARGFPGYAIGADSAPVEIVEYADFQCPACRQQWALTVLDVKDRLVRTGRVRWVFRDFPLDMHANAQLAHHAAACSADQNRFWEMHDVLFERQPEWASSTAGRAARQLRGYAESVGVDVAEYDACMSEGRHRGRIQASMEEGFSRGVNGTPTYLIGRRLYSSLYYDDIKRIVDSLDTSETP